MREHERIKTVNDTSDATFVLCSMCFQDHGLALDAQRIGTESESVCPNCGSPKGKKLTVRAIEVLAHRFFVRGTIYRVNYGGAPRVQFNRSRKTEINAAPWFEPDMRLIEKVIGVGFFYYGPRLWMVGEIEPLKNLQDSGKRASIIERIIKEYPAHTLGVKEQFYRLRIAPNSPQLPAEYDSPPKMIAGRGRLDSAKFPVLYGS